MMSKAYHRDYLRQYFKDKPWMRAYWAAKARCEYKNNIGYKSYGAKGISFLLTPDEIEFLWFRDGASFMKRPSIDRRNAKGDYDLNNCRYIEMVENAARTRREMTHCKRGHPFDDGNTILYKGERCCRKCKYIKNREYTERKKICAQALKRSSG